MATDFPRYPGPFSRRISASVLFFFLLAGIPSSSANFSFYDKDDIEEFVGLCSGCTKCADTLCTLECNTILRKDSAKAYHATENTCENAVLKEFKMAQETVRKFKEKLESYTQSIVLWALFTPSICIGAYLIAVGHFDYRTLPIVGSKYFPNPTHGITYWQYHRMRYVVHKSELTKDSEPGTSFVVDETSSIGTGSSSDSADSDVGIDDHA